MVLLVLLRLLVFTGFAGGRVLAWFWSALLGLFVLFCFGLGVCVCGLLLVVFVPLGLLCLVVCLF